MHHIIKLKIHLNEKKIRLNNSFPVSGFQYGRVQKENQREETSFICILNESWHFQLDFDGKKSALAHCNDTFFFIGSLRFFPLRSHALLRSFFFIGSIFSHTIIDWIIEIGSNFGSDSWHWTVFSDFQAAFLWRKTMHNDSNKFY